MAKKRMRKLDKVVNIAAILVTIASLFAAVCWISSGKAGSEASDRRTASLGFMMLRLESSTEASTAQVQAQSYLTQAGMYFAYADKENNDETRSYLENLGYQSIDMSNFYLSKAENAENRAQSYYEAYEQTLGSSTAFGRMSDFRSTGALIFNMSAIVASCGVLFKRKEILYVFLPTFAVGLIYLIMSLL